MLSHPIGPFCNLVLWDNLLGPSRGPIMLGHPIWPPCWPAPLGDTPSFVREREVGAPRLRRLMLFHIFDDIWARCFYLEWVDLLIFNCYFCMLRYIRKTCWFIRMHGMCDILFLAIYFSANHVLVSLLLHWHHLQGLVNLGLGWSRG